MGWRKGKFNDYATAKFDVRIVSGSTLPVNRWAYLEELKQLLNLGVVDDIAVLSETDIRNKDKIAQRKSMYSQLQGRLGQMEEVLKDKEGTIETLERQLVQAGIKGKVKDAEMEIVKKKEQEKAAITVQANKAKDSVNNSQQRLAQNAENQKMQMQQNVQNIVGQAQQSAQQTKNKAELDAKVTRANANLESMIVKNSVGNEG